ncbi:MAG: hypothetical protein ACTS4V_00570 [Candidatus Hodgkinia cicadicola]
MRFRCAYKFTRIASHLARLTCFECSGGHFLALTRPSKGKARRLLEAARRSLSKVKRMVKDFGLNVVSLVRKGITLSLDALLPI